MGSSDTLPVLTSAISLGLLHGLEPGHGWLVAAAFALRHPRRWWYGGWAAVILSCAHLTSTFVVVGLFVAADHMFEVGSYPWLHVLAGLLLVLMAVHQWRSPGHHHRLSAGAAPADSAARVQDGQGTGEGPARRGGHDDGDRHDHEHDHPHGHGRRDPERAAAGSLLGLVGFAFALGFVHEEEFAIIALAAGRTNPWLVMTAYALSVAVSLIVLTLLSIMTLNRLERRIHRIERWLPRASAVILALMGIVYMLGLV